MVHLPAAELLPCSPVALALADVRAAGGDAVPACLAASHAQQRSGHDAAHLGLPVGWQAGEGEEVLCCGHGRRMREGLEVSMEFDG